MLKLQKISFLRFFLLTLGTLGVYLVIWALRTKNALNRAGGNVPNGILLVLPVLNVYFWYKYAQAYVEIVKKSTRDQDVLFYFITPMVASSALGLVFRNWVEVVEKQYALTQTLLGATPASILSSIIFIAISLTVFVYASGINYLFYQKGFNEYSE